MRHDPAALAAREAEITGKPQRVEALGPDAVDDETMATIVAVRAGAGVHSMSRIPGFFGVTMKHPALFRAQMDMGSMLFAGLIPPREREIAVLRVAWWCRAPYEWGEHVDIAKRYGVTDAEVERVTRGADAEGWAAHDAAIVRGVEELLGEQMLSDVTWAALARTWSEAQLIEFPILVGQYFATALQQNALRIRLSEDNPGLRHR